MNKKKILFIINPKSGTGGKQHIPDLIARTMDKERFEYTVAFTEGPKHGTTLGRRAAENQMDAVVAVGGDGSVNEIAKGLLGSETALGILPTGSGNGLALHLGISKKLEKALEVIQAGQIVKIDTVKINDEFCIGTIGVGFDAHIAHLFATSPKRGYATYVKLVLSEFYKYKPLLYDMEVDGKRTSVSCFLLTFANSSQFGNNAVIAPFADVQDGILDISMMDRFPAWKAPHLIYRLMNNIIHKSRYFNMLKCKSVVLKNDTVLKGHIDGEPVTFTTDLHVKIIPASLNILVAKQ